MNPSDYYHAIPLHYVPHLFKTGKLHSQRRLADLGLPIAPRPSAAKRDRKLNLDRYVHLSLKSITPLLIDKRRLGYPHVLLEFGPEIADIPGAAYLKYNTKSWRHRDDFVPIRDPADVSAFVEEWASGSYPSAELLIPDDLPLAGYCRRAIFATDTGLSWVQSAIRALDISPPPFDMRTGSFPVGPEADLTQHNIYLARCAAAGALLDPPEIPFD